MFRRLNSLSLIFILLLSSFDIYAFGPAIRYSGLTIEEVQTLNVLNQNNKNGKGANSLKTDHCLSIIESSPYESKKIFYSQRQFIDLVRRNPFIAQHVENTLKVDMEKFTKYLVDKFDERTLKSSCLNLDSLLKFRAEMLNETIEIAFVSWKSEMGTSAHCHFQSNSGQLGSREGQESKAKLEWHFPIYKEGHSTEDKYVIRKYEDPRYEFRKYWRNEHLGPEDIREMVDIEEYLKLANKFLINYKTVTNKQKKPKANDVEYPEYELEDGLYKAYKHGLLPEDMQSSEEVKEAMEKLAKSKNLTVEQYREQLEKKLNLSFDEIIKNLVQNFDQEIKEEKEASNGSLTSISLLEQEKAQTQGQDQLTSPTPSSTMTTIKMEVNNILEKVSLRHLAKNIFYEIQKKRIKRGQKGIEPKIVFPQANLDDPTLEESPLLKRLHLKEEMARKKLEKLLSEHQVSLDKRKNLASSQDPDERLELLNKKITEGQANAQEIKEYQDLLVQSTFGFDPQHDKKGPQPVAKKIYEPVKKVFQNYNWYVTDTIVDMAADKFVDASLDFLRPLSKNRAKVFRAVKGMDGAFVFSTTIMGWSLAPFTFGLSEVAATAIRTGMTSLFSILASAARREDMDSTLLRAGVRAGHSLLEGLIPGLGDVNAMFTSLDDLRVAFKIHEYANKMIRGKDSAVKARWETLGSPLVLAFLRERLNYVSQGLLPRGKFFLAYANLPLSTKKILSKVVEDLDRAKIYLQKSLVKSRLRYDYLLKAGKIPNMMLSDVIINLDREERDDKFYSQERFQESALMEEMKRKVIK